jgi:hypothetical protein
MTVRSVLPLCALAVTLSSIGCAGTSSQRPSPNAPSADQQQADSNDSSPRTPQPPHDPPPSTGTCVAEKSQWAIGQRASAALLERARIDATASVARFIRPNEAVTMEFSPARLNLHLDAHDIVHGVICG